MQESKIDMKADALTRILVLDGAMGTMIQRYKLVEQDYRGELFKGSSVELKGNNECLNLTRPDIIEDLHREYIAAGADIIETNSFNANSISQTEYGLEEKATTMALEAAKIARRAADSAGRRVLVAGSVGPSGKSLTLAQDIDRPYWRQYDFDAMSRAFFYQIKALIEGGVDIILLETFFDALNAKAAIYALEQVAPGFPLMISATISDRSGRTLTGQTLEAFYTSVCHANLFSFGINCALGPDDMIPLVEEISSFAECRVSCHPNAGIPDEKGDYILTPILFADSVKKMAEAGFINIAGGCCGTTPEHIRAVAETLAHIPARILPQRSDALKVCGLDVVTVERSRNFTNIGERTNVAGSRKFAKIIAAGDYDAALQIASSQIIGGADIIDVNMDDVMLDSTAEMEHFLRCAANDPSVSRATIMIDSSHWATLLVGLKNVQGKCIVNSISLKDGEYEFLQRASTIHMLGASMVVMAFDEQGQATTFERKIEIAQRAYNLLTSIGISPHDIIFDVNVLTIGTGMSEHERYALDFIDAVRWIKTHLKGALTSGGVSNLSFAFRGNNKVREAMHSVFLYHAIAAGLDMAIVNPTMLQIYDSIDGDLLRCIEDVIFARDSQSTQRLVSKAQELMGATSLQEKTPSGFSEKDNSDPIERLTTALVKGASVTLTEDIKAALAMQISPTALIEGPLMSGMETVGRLFGVGKMFLPQVIKSAKIMKDAVAILQPYIDGREREASEHTSRRKFVIATVKGDVHDIGKNITAIVLQCNGFEVHDLGVMVSEEEIISEAKRIGADAIGVSGLITPSLFRMEELCRKMSLDKMSIPLFVGGAAASLKHTALKLRPLYADVHYAADASQTAVKAVRCLTDPIAFKRAEDAEFSRFAEPSVSICTCGLHEKHRRTAVDRGVHTFTDVRLRHLRASDVVRHFDWKLMLGICGIKEQSDSVADDVRTSALQLLSADGYDIRVAVRFFECYAEDDSIVSTSGDLRLPMLRQEDHEHASLCDFFPLKGRGNSQCGLFAVSVSDTVDGDDMLLEHAVRVCLAEAASTYLHEELGRSVPDGTKLLMPGIGYACCPDHSLKSDVLSMLPPDLGISLTEGYSMLPEASICGLVIAHPSAYYTDITSLSTRAFADYAHRRGVSEEQLGSILGYLLAGAPNKQ